MWLAETIRCRVQRKTQSAPTDKEGHFTRKSWVIVMFERIVRFRTLARAWAIAMFERIVRFRRTRYTVGRERASILRKMAVPSNLRKVQKLFCSRCHYA